MALRDEVQTLVQLIGAREYAAEAREVARANRRMALDAELLGREMERTTKRSYLMNQALFTLRRMVYGVTLAFVASTALVFSWGWQFNNSMQQARVALEKAFPSAQALNKELIYLFNFTKYTPFQFKDVTLAFRSLYAAFKPLGISVDTTNQTIKALVDALSFAGKVSPGQLNRVSIALQHMAYQGHLTGYQVNQLSRDGIPLLAILRKEFNLTGEQIHRIGTLGIPTLAVLQAITKYVKETPYLNDAARRQALGTFHGQFTTFKDNMSQIMGAVEQGFFKRSQNSLTRLNDFFNSIAKSTKGAHSLTDIVKDIDIRLTPNSHGVLMFWRQLSGAVEGFFKFFTGLIKEMAKSQTVWGIFYVALALLNGAFAILNPQMHLIATVLKILLPMWIAYHIYLKAAAFWTGALAFEEAVLTGKTKELTFAQLMFRLWLDRSIYTEKIGIGVMVLWGTVMEQARLGVWSLAAAVDASIFKLKALRLGMLGMAGLVITAAILLELIPHAKRNPDVSAPSNNPVQRAITRIPIIGGAASQVGAAADWINKRLHNLHIPGFASGGMTGWPGTFMVGERGPELVHLPQGTGITPNSQLPTFGRSESWMTGAKQPIEIILKLNERVLERIMVEIDSDRYARA